MTTIATPYCAASDLLLGDMTISSSIDLDLCVQNAADEMNGEIGQRYTIPLTFSATSPTWVALKLKGINARLASGRLLMSLAVAHEDASVNAYALLLVKGALDELQQLVNGSTGIPGAAIDPSSFKSTAPQIVNHDAFSAIDQFEELVMRPKPNFVHKPRWRPGPAMTGEIAEPVNPPGPTPPPTP